MIQSARFPIASLLIRAGLLLLAATPVARAQAPVIGEIVWHRADAHCAFAPADSAGAGESGPYIFVTELASDDQMAVERGYMRIDGLLRELALVERKEEEAAELRVYRTFGDMPVEVTIAMRPGETRKSAQGQVVLTRYAGTVTAAHGNSRRQVAFAGACGREAGE